MRIFIKYFLWFLSSLAIVFFYFINTSVGHQNLGYLIEDYLSKKTYNNIKVHSLNLEKYPQIVMNITVNNSATVLLEGEVDNYKIDMEYHLKGEEFRFNNFYIEDKIELFGSLHGLFSELLVEGKGSIFNGNVIFGFTKVPKKIQDMNIVLSSVDSQKVLKFLKKPTLIEGKADITAEFLSFSKYKKRGHAKISMDKALMLDVAPLVPFSLNTNIDFDDITYKYIGTITSKIGSLNITNGEYHQNKKVAQADYELHLKDLAYFEKFLKHKYIGSLDSNGSVIYDDALLVRGYTEKFGGKLEYLYKRKNIDLNLKEVYLERLLEQFSYPTLLHANVSGTINYDMDDKIILINTELRKTRFVKNKITRMLYQTAGIDLLSGVYDKSTFTGGYQNNLLTSELKIDDGKSHLYLVDTKMNSKSNSVNSKFEIKMQGQEIYGDIYGTLQDPKVSVDMSRLLKYQMNKQMGAWLGTEKSEVVKRELKGVKKDVVKKLEDIDVVEDVTETAKSLLNGFF
jgi:hypothetical protein